MESLKELLGFVVLTGPLFVILLWFPLSIWVARVTAKRAETKNKRLLVGSLVFVLMFLLPFADGILGYLEFKYLCATEAGIAVYQTVQLPREYWDAGGRARFFTKYGNLNAEFSDEQLTVQIQSTDRPFFHVDRDVSKILKRADHTLLAEIVTFRFWGGWIQRNLSPSNTAQSCGFIRERGFNQDLYLKIFVPED